MEINRVEWLRAARENTGIRRMLGLVLLVLASSETSEAERNLAMRLKTLLDDIAGQAIAPAARLKRVRRRFAALYETVEFNVLTGGAHERHDPHVGGMRRL